MSTMAHSFSASPPATIPRSKFDRSHTHKTTFDAGYLIPVYVDEALPGDTFSCHMSAFARMATPIFPIMDNLYMDTHFFAVPVRLLWDNWERMNGAQTDPGDSTDYLVPTITSTASTGYLESTIYDYMGIPTKVADLEHSALWLRAYNLIYNDWYRDENLIDSVSVPTDDGPDDPTLYTLLRRGKRHDYFTSSLPWPQKGPAVEFPLGITAPVVSTGVAPTFQPLTGTQFTSGLMSWSSVTASRFAPANSAGPADGVPIMFGSQTDNTLTGLEADLASATATTVNQMREAFQIQKLYERDARGGTRYTEIIRSHFGVLSSDARLQRPEFLGGGSASILVHPVPQTTGGCVGSCPVTPTNPLGTMGAFATISTHGQGFTKSFEEHSVVIGIVSIRADLTYQQGLERMWSRQTRFDFYWPVFSHLGEQSVLNKEIYAQGTSADDDVFGYQERYAEYRYKNSYLTGKFRSNATGSYDLWHLSQDFATLPTLSESFIEEDPPVPRVIATPEEPQFLFDSFFKVICARPMPVYSVPGLVDHF